MKKLSLNEMQSIQGGGPYCRQALIGVAGIMAGAIMSNPIMVVMGAVGFYGNVITCVKQEDGIF
jgi:bacteriocin-like protein